MIQLQIDTKQLVEELNNKIAGIKEMQAPSVLATMSKIVFTITGERFMVATDQYARRNPKKMHHVYEWGGIGNPAKRLFVLERQRLLGGNLMIVSRFLPSRMPVPINPGLLNPGPNGRVVSRKNIFRNKASVMESGQMISFTAKSVLAFMGNDGIVFVKPGTTINIAHPGGLETNDAFSKHMLEWYTTRAALVLDGSGVYERISNDVSIALSVKGAGITATRMAVERIANTIVGGKDVIV